MVKRIYSREEEEKEQYRRFDNSILWLTILSASIFGLLVLRSIIQLWGK